MINFRDVIVADRKKRIRREGFSQGLIRGSGIPARRELPVVPFGRKPFVVCEVKRRSPSRGDIAPDLDPVRQAGLYMEAGVRSVSVLTEQDHFGGSLKDLMEVKTAWPGLSVLRKDFLFSREDIETSFLAGADAVLLIASILSLEDLAALMESAAGFGMTALVEVHSVEDVRKAEILKPRLLGINSRNLETFAIDKLHPLFLRRHVSWDADVIFESGITCGEDAVLAYSSGFSGILVGEAAVRYPGLPAELAAAADAGPGRGFWDLLARRKKGNRPLVKICGLTRKEDVLLADTLGADILGFILAPSPRRTQAAFIAGIGPTRALKAGIVVLDEKASALPPDADALLREGLLDVIQFHGTEHPKACFGMAFPYYKALSLSVPGDAGRLAEFSCPRVLIDAPKSGMGSALPGELIREAASIRPLWLAGGIGPDNVSRIIREYHPELIDSASRLELSPGVKDPHRVKRFFLELDHALS